MTLSVSLSQDFACVSQTSFDASGVVQSWQISSYKGDKPTAASQYNHQI
jgi:hypothetical protein